MKNKIIVISLGGSLIVPNEIDWKFLKQFKELILKFVKKNCRFIIERKKFSGTVINPRTKNTI